MTPLLIESAIKVSVLIAIALLANRLLLRKRSSALRHWFLAVATLCSLAVPAVDPLLPSWRVPLNVPGRVHAKRPDAGSVPPTASPSAPPAASASADTHGTLQLLGAVWSIGIGASLIFLLIGLIRLQRVTARARRVRSGPWHRVGHEIAQHYGVRRPVELLQSDHPTMLVTWGVLRPRVILPAGAEDWSTERIRVVLCHELAHIKRGDWSTLLAAELLRSLYWFNPLPWLLCSRLRQESEHACDDAVLSAGVESPVYATHLVDLARTFAAQKWSPAPAIAHPSTLERRVKAMLNAHLDRRPITRLAKSLIVAALVGISLPIAAMAQNAFSTFSGVVLDPQDGFLPNARVMLTNPQTTMKYEVRADATGRFEFVGLPPADYSFEAVAPGFATLRGTLTVTGQDVQRDIRLQIGELEETITVTESSGRRPMAPSRAKRPLPTCTTASFAGRAGGNLRPPQKILDVRPIYPASVPDAKPEESVLLDATIATDGTIKDVQVHGSANPAFASAAMDAIREWRFDETTLNCAPVEVAMKVSVTFRRQQQ